MILVMSFGIDIMYNIDFKCCQLLLILNTMVFGMVKKNTFQLFDFPEQLKNILKQNKYYDNILMSILC